MIPARSPAILLEQVSRSFGRVQALRTLSFSLAPGEFVGLIGHNGAGKSTAIRILTGQLPPSSGQVYVGGIDVQANPRGARAIMGYVPEAPALYEYLTAREFLTFIAQVRGRGDVDEALELASLGEDADRLIREYSQGMRRRTALAAAMVARPPVLILDEAMNGLDPPSAARIKTALADLCEQGHTVLLSTHVLETVERVAHRVLMLAHGRLVADASTEDMGQEGLERLFLQLVARSEAAGKDDREAPPDQAPGPGT